MPLPRSPRKNTAIAALALLFLGAGRAAPLVAPRPTPRTTASSTARQMPKNAATAATKTLYLTFDADMTQAMLARLRDGKVAAWYDPDLIAFLRKRRLPSTVFMTGLFAEAYPNLAKSLASDPLFSLQNHSYDHAAFEKPCYGLRTLASDAEKLAEIVKTQDVLAKIAGASPLFFRYPGLCRDAHDDELVARAGLTVADGDIISGDAFSKNPGAIASAIIRHAHGGGVVVLHLGGPNASSTLRALKAAVPKLEAAGYAFGLLPPR